MVTLAAIRITENDKMHTGTDIPRKRSNAHGIPIHLHRQPIKQDSRAQVTQTAKQVAQLSAI